MKKTSITKYQKCLNAIFNDCQTNGSIDKVSDYSSMFGVNQTTFPGSLKRLGIIKKEGNSLVWNRRKPDKNMAIQVLKQTQLKGLNKKEKDLPKNVSSPKVIRVSVDDVIEAFSILPETLSKEERKNIAKKLVAWKNS